VPGETEESPFETVQGFAINKAGEKLLATDKGLYTFYENTGKFELVKVGIQLTPLNDLAYSNSTPTQTLWLTSNAGILNFSSQKQYTTANSELQNNTVSRMNFDTQNRAYFALPKELTILDNQKWTTSSGSNDLYKNYAITDIASTVDGFTYVTTNGGGVERLKMDVDGISGATIFDTDWTKLESNTVYTVYTDSITQVYGTDMGVAIHFSESTKWDWETYAKIDGLIGDTVISVVKDGAKNWWFGTTQGLSSFNNSTWTNYSVETNHIISNNIKILSVDADGTVWFACNEGLSHFVNGSWVNYSK